MGTPPSLWHSEHRQSSLFQPGLTITISLGKVSVHFRYMFTLLEERKFIFSR